MFLLAGAAASNALDLLSSLQQALSGSNSTQSPTTFDPAAAAGTPATPSTPSTTPTSGTPSAPSAPLSPATMSALFSLQGQGQGQQPLLMVNGDALSQQLFSMLDTNGDGQISQSEFDTAFGQNGNTTQANSLFAQISNGTGSITPQDLTNALDGQDQAQAQGQGQTQGLTQGMQGHHHHHHGGGGGGGGFDVASLIGGAGGASASGSASSGSGSNSSTQGDTTQTVSNSNGSSTTTISYADGSQVTMTTPAASSSSSSQNSNSGAGSASSLNNFVEQMIQRQAQMLASSTVGQSVAVSA
jgi:hypothetical protein